VRTRIARGLGEALHDVVGRADVRIATAEVEERLTARPRGGSNALQQADEVLLREPGETVWAGAHGPDATSPRRRRADRTYPYRLAERFVNVHGTADLAFERMYRRHRVELYRWLLRETGDPDIAEDVLQTAFVNAYRALLHGDPPREPRSWLFAIARNANRGRFRHRRVLETGLDEDLPLFRDESLVAELRDALATLPVNQRAAIVLQEVAGLTYAEIAERLGVTTSSVQMLVFRARRNLRSELRGERRAARLLLPLQPALSALSRLLGGGERALLLRGAAGLAGAAAIGGGVLAVSGDASPPARAALDSASSAAVRPAAVRAAQPMRASASFVSATVRKPASRGRTPTRVSSTPPAASAQGPDTSPAGSPTSAPGTSSPSARAPTSGMTASEILNAPTTVTSTVSTTVSDTVDLVNDTVSSLPTVPEVTTPTVTTPEVTTPEVTTPEVTVPQITVPQITVPSPLPVPTAPLVTP
jgi:RNA polymerase sigma-70 factor (ECF subfamily)